MQGMGGGGEAPARSICEYLAPMHQLKMLRLSIVTALLKDSKGLQQAKGKKNIKMQHKQNQTQRNVLLTEKETSMKQKEMET